MSKRARKAWVGFDLGGTKMMAVVFDQQFKVLATAKAKTPVNEGAKAVLTQIRLTIREALHEAKIAPRALSGIGVGCPGVLDLDTGVILEAPNLAWRRVPLRRLLGRWFRCRVVLANDVDAGTYYDNEKGVFVGLFSAEDKTYEELIELYKWMVKEYPFVILEDPLDEDDFEGHARLTRELPIEIVGDDLFTTNSERVRRGIEVGAANAVLLKVNQVGTITEAFEMTRLAHRNGYGVMPCGSRGEGADIADYAVGLITGHLREGGTGDTGNRLLRIEEELGSRAQFAGRSGLRVKW